MKAKVLGCSSAILCITCTFSKKLVLMGKTGGISAPQSFGGRWSMGGPTFSEILGQGEHQCVLEAIRARC